MLTAEITQLHGLRREMVRGINLLSEVKLGLYLVCCSKSLPYIRDPLKSILRLLRS
jgi:hypothetical protein